MGQIFGSTRSSTCIIDRIDWQLHLGLFFWFKQESMVGDRHTRFLWHCEWFVIFFFYPRIKRVGGGVGKCVCMVMMMHADVLCMHTYAHLTCAQLGNGGVARSMLSEITDETNRAKAFSLFGFCWGIGMIGTLFISSTCRDPCCIIQRTIPWILWDTNLNFIPNMVIFIFNSW